MTGVHLKEDLLAKGTFLPSFKERCLKILSSCYLARFSDYKMEKLVKQNKGTTFFMSILGHEIIGATAAASLTFGKDWSFPYYRDRSFAIGIGCDLKELFGAFLARDGENHSGGRMMPEHFSHKKLKIACQSSVVGSQYLQAVGVAQGIKFAKGDEVVYVSGGDGSTSQGDFHEALNFAAIHALPIIFVIEDNGWAISVPAKEQTAGSIADIAKGYKGVAVFDIDGGNFLSLFEAFENAVKRGRCQMGPSLIRVSVPRLCPHSNSDDPRKYKDELTILKEKARDPLPLFEKWLLSQNFIDEKGLELLKEQLKIEVEEVAREADLLPFPQKESASTKVFADFKLGECREAGAYDASPITMIEGINHALKEEMEDDENLVIFGEDVAREKGGAFGVSRNLTRQFPERCFNTPLAESTIIGLAIGLAFHGKYKPIAEIQFADYIWTGINQIVNELASIYYRSNGVFEMPVVIRMPYGGYIQGGPYHSQSVEALLTHTPGLKVVVPSNAADAKRLLKTAIRDPNPVIFLEHKALYRDSIGKSKEPSKGELLPFGVANVVREGRDVTLLAWGLMVHLAVKVASELECEKNLSIEVIDLRTLNPLDMTTILTSLKKTGRIVILHEAPKTAGFGAELAAKIAEEGFFKLDAPIVRVAGKDCAIPYCKELEKAVLPSEEELKEAILKLLSN